MSGQLDEKMLKLARMVEQGVAEKELAIIFNTSEASLVKVFGTQGYADALAHVSEEAFTRRDVLNRGWDGIEEHALGHVYAHLTGPVPDPDYALRAAMVANKAARRGKHINEPIAVQPNMQSVIQLNATYVGKLEQNFHVAPRPPAAMEKAETNMLSVQGVKTLLGAGEKTVTEAVVIGDLDGIDFLNA